ncbi:glycosyltransferase [Arthrobacter sp. zg-ZUI100]|uniref:glycosyltransferase n=1 Tax=Arthrobacter jiangjiafuii TaxID=2817475 RepID=UPI001AEEA3E7|nr:glycosyltransferase [Arthrobacter jiangjiafuii]MBP3037161.1 glycosyltransferase [Arthrobacter jiangjiafuii]
MNSGKNLFISWTIGNPRTRDLGRHLGIDVSFVHHKGSLITRYIKQTLATWKLLRAEKPKVVVIMLPPLPLLLVAAIYAKLHRGFIIADMHTGAFNDPRWKWSLSLTLRLLRNHSAIVTNNFLAEICRDKGVRAEVLHDAIESSRTGSFPVKPTSVLCPVSYANDEPIENIIHAAKVTPELDWIFTGNAPEDVKKAAPENVTFTGYVTNDSFNQLMEEAGVVVALTTRPHTMQRAGYEALSFGVPQVTSDFSVLREFLADAAFYTELSGSAIARSVQIAVEQRHKMASDVIRVRGLRMREQQDQLAKIRLAVEEKSA